MRKKLLPFITIVAMLLLGACSNEDIVSEAKTSPDASRVLSFTASMPSKPGTRVALEEKADKSIDLVWEENDEIKFAFVQAETIANSTATVTSISNGGKTAQFAIPLPDGINDAEPFTLYGVYGGSVVSGTDVTLPANPGNTTSLANIDLMLYFKQIVTPGEELAVTFNHLGSLFSINLKNTHSSQLSYTGIEFRLVGVGGDAKWAYNNAEGGQAFDLATEKFKNTETAGNFISFKVPNSTVVPAGGIIKLWGWYPTLADKNWPELKLKLLNNGAPHKEGSNFKAARTSPTAVGRNFSFYVVYNGADYKFSDESFKPFITQKEVVLDVPTMGTLGTLLAEYDKAYIEKLTLTGKINTADFEFMKIQLPNMTYLDLSGVTSEGDEIPDGAFQNHKCLTNVVFPPSITVIDKRAFTNCSSLVGPLNLPEGLKEINLSAFENTSISGLLKLPSTMEKIGIDAFKNCIGITSLEINDGFQTIAREAFYGCVGITGRIIFPSSVALKARAFAECSDNLVFRFPHLDPISYAADMLPPNATVEVPSEAVDIYRSTDRWSVHKIVGY